MTDFEQRVQAAKRHVRANAWDGIERSTVTTTLEVRESASGWQIAGRGIVYDKLSENLGGYREIIKPGAATSVLASEPDIRGLFNHDPNLILGRTTAGTMTVTEVDGGVDYVIDAPDTSYAANLRTSLERGDVTQSSFAFRIAAGGAEWTEDPETGGLIRVVTEFSGLYDMSPVVYPAYPDTVSGARAVSLAEAERESMASTTGERDEMAESVDVEASWRLHHVQRRIRLRT